MVQGGGGQESTVITTETRDGNGNLVSEPFLVKFEVQANAPNGVYLNEIDDLNEILNEILNYASPKNQSTIIQTSIKDIIEKTIRLLSKEAQNSKIEIQYNNIDDFIIKSIPGQLKEILFNLLLNGIQACKGKGDKIEITVEDSKDYVTIKVLDNGPGIDENKNVFEPFFTTKPHGLGLGLMNAKNIIKEHNGTIKVRSKMGSGTTFAIELPIGET